MSGTIALQSQPRKRGEVAGSQGRRQGDAFTQELVAALPFLKRLAKSMSHDSSLAEDLAQQTALRAWAARERYRIGSDMRAWLAVILRNEYFSIKRRSWRSIPLDPERTACLEWPGQQDASAALADAARAIGSLPKNQRQAFIAVAIGGESYRELATASHCSTGTIKSRVSRARSEIRQKCSAADSHFTCDRPPPGGALDSLLNQLEWQHPLPRGAAAGETHR